MYRVIGIIKLLMNILGIMVMVMKRAFATQQVTAFLRTYLFCYVKSYGKCGTIERVETIIREKNYDGKFGKSFFAPTNILK